VVDPVRDSGKEVNGLARSEKGRGGESFFGMRTPTSPNSICRGNRMKGTGKGRWEVKSCLGEEHERRPHEGK